MVATLTSQPWTHMLIRLQLSQGLTTEFLAFAHDWLTLLRITLGNCKEDAKRYISKYNPVTRTLVLMKKRLDAEDQTFKEVNEKILCIIDNIATDSSIKLK